MKTKNYEVRFEMFDNSDKEAKYISATLPKSRIFERLDEYKQLFDVVSVTIYGTEIKFTTEKPEKDEKQSK